MAGKDPDYGNNYVTNPIWFIDFVSFPLQEYLEQESGTPSTITIRICSVCPSGH